MGEGALGPVTQLGGQGQICAMLAAPAGWRTLPLEKGPPLQSLIQRFGALFGAIASIGVPVILIIEGEPPDVSETSAEEILAHWVGQGDGALFTVWLSSLIGLLLVFWGLWANSALRDRGATLLAPAAVVGTIFLAVGIGVDAASRLALLEAAEHIPLESVVAISATLQYLYLPFLFGMFLITISVSATAKQTGLIPSWLAWVGYATALILVIPHEVSFLGFMVFLPWMLITGIIMFRKAGAAA